MIKSHSDGFPFSTVETEDLRKGQQFRRRRSEWTYTPPITVGSNQCAGPMHLDLIPNGIRDEDGGKIGEQIEATHLVQMNASSAKSVG
jgi:hypothetical protein